MISDKRIDGGKAFDWGLTSEDYAKYRDIYPEEFYKRIADLGLCVNGQSVLDLGTGTGVLPRNMYKYGAKFTGTDISENQIRYAKELSKGMNIDYIVSSSENLNFPENSFDVVTACQCFMYFDKNVIFDKIHEWLKPGAHLLILYMAWLPFESDIAKFSEDLVLKYNPEWTGGRMTRYKPQIPDESKGLFSLENSITFDLPVSFTREAWNGRMKACRGVGASLSSKDIGFFEKEHMRYLETLDEPFDIPHYASILDLKKI